MLSRAGLRVAPTVRLDPEDDEHAVGAALQALDATDAAACGVLVRAAQPASTPFTAIVAHPSAPFAWARDAAATIADVVGVPAARFLAGVTADSRDALDAALTATVLRAAKEPWPATLSAQVAFLSARARKRQPSAGVMLQRLDAASAYGIAASRDTRTGSGPVRASCATGPLAIADGPSTPRALAEVEALAGVRAAIELASAQLEADARAVVRFAFMIGDDGPTFLWVAPQRRTARSSCAIAADLATTGAVPVSEVLALVEPPELAACFTVRVEPSPTAPATSGVAAGGGIARGRAAFSTARALELSRAGIPSILIVPEVEPEDADAVRAASGIVVLRGGITGEGAIMARALGKPCVAAGGVIRRLRGDSSSTAASAIDELAPITVDGGAGRVFAGPVVLEPADAPREAALLLELAEGSMPAAVHAMVSCPEDVETARRFGATQVVVWDFSELVLDALLDPGDPGDAMAARLSGVLTAAARLGLRAAVRLGAPSPALLGVAGRDDAAGARALDGARRALDAFGPSVQILDAVGDGARGWEAFGAGSPAGPDDPTEVACSPTLVPAARFASARRRRVYRPSPA